MAAHKKKRSATQKWKKALETSQLGVQESSKPDHFEADEIDRGKNTSRAGAQKKTQWRITEWRIAGEEYIPTINSVGVHQQISR